MDIILIKAIEKLIAWLFIDYHDQSLRLMSNFYTHSLFVF